MYGKAKALLNVGIASILLTTIYTAILVTITHVNKKRIEYLYNREKEKDLSHMYDEKY